MIIVFIFPIVAPYVPSEFMPLRVLRRYAGKIVPLYCPFHNVGNPIPNCTWSRIDNNNISHEIQLSDSKVLNTDSSYCKLHYIFTESDNGLYQCTGSNIVGSTTYTFPERFIIESEQIIS